jgi:3,4-dihydroxy-2-butanone 4-phosphate synthase
MTPPIHEVAVSRHIDGERQPQRTGVDAAVADLAAGRMVVLCDDAERGGEGDLLIAAERVGAEAVNFMAKEARGLICLALAAGRADELGLAPIGTRGNSRLGDASMVSIEARDGVSTGISAADRARTIAVAADPASRSEDLVQPGHIFPLRARPGGVLEREGRVEAAVELAVSAGTGPAAVLCQVMRDDGHMARGEDLERFAEHHGLAIVRVSEVVAERRGSEPRPPTEVPDTGRQMREVMGHFATGVTVVTARGADGTPVGTTANAISSVSLRPPLLLACLAESSETLAAIRSGGNFAVNVLGRHQREHSDRFAAKGAEARAHEVAFDEHALGVPVLPDSLATIACEVEAIHPAGDHQIVLGLARSLERADAAGAEPLLFYRGAYSQLTLEEDDLAA